MEKNHIFPFLWMRGEEESILRKEMEKIAECGIGAVCIEARPHNEFCQDGWWHDVDIIIDEAKKRDMKIWILDDKHFPTGYANGLIAEKYPERKKWYINRSKANICGFPNRKMTINLKQMMKPAIGFWEIDQFFQNMPNRAQNQMLAIVAVKVKEGRVLEDEIIDLTDTADGEFATFTLPEGMWSVFVVFKTQTDGGREDYINMIDKESAATQIEGVYEAHYERYGAEFGKTIAGFFSDEPQFGNTSEVHYEAKVGRKKMPLPWSQELEEMLDQKYEGDYKKYLPFLFQDGDEKIQHQIRYDYMDFVSKLYKKNFSDAIGKWCEDHGVEYIGHVVEDNGCHSRLGMGAAHFFRAMSGQHMAGIDIIGEQVVFGAPVQGRQGLGEMGGEGEFYHYAIGKMGASAGHLDPKKKGRILCELFGAYGWNFGVRDMKYVLDHLLVRGVNELVPHAFSMAEYPDEDCPPHFYARGNNPQFPAFAELMKYANRMCEMLSNGTHVASVAVLYDAEADWVDNTMPMQKVCRTLMEHQIDFDIVCIDMLNDLASYNGSLADGRLVINGVNFDALIVPSTKTIPQEFLRFLEQKGTFPVIFVDAYPTDVINAVGADAVEKVLALSEVMPLCEIASQIRSRGFAEIIPDHDFELLSYYHYQTDRNLFMFQNESTCDTFKGTICLPTDQEILYYDGWKDLYESTECRRTENGMEITLELAPAESVLLVEAKGEKTAGMHQSFRSQVEGCESLDLTNGWEVSLQKAITAPAVEETIQMEELVPISDLRPTFSGIITYKKNIALDQVPRTAYLKAGQVYEIMQVTVNGADAGMRITQPYQLDVAPFLKEGENTIEIRVLTTPARDQLNFPMRPFDFSYEAMEATGMDGKIELLMK